MEKQIKAANPAKEVIFIDQESIDLQTRAVNDTLPFMQAIYDAYNAVPGVQPLDTESFQLIFYDFNTFIENCKLFWYNKNFAASHKSIGITQAKGIKLVDDQLPDFTSFEGSIMAYRKLFDQPYNQSKYSKFTANVEAFEIQDNVVVISPRYIDLYTENAKVYLESDTEFKVRDTVNALILIIKTLSELLPNNAFSFEVFGSYPKVMDFNRLYELFDVVYPRFEGEVLKFDHKIDFYRKLKEYLKNTGQL